MRFGYWLPVFGGWLRNVEDEGMEASWSYVSKLARRSEEIGFDLSLIAELNLNDMGCSSVFICPPCSASTPSSRPAPNRRR